jgi:DNA-binding MarR family transcriptional regulator
MSLAPDSETVLAERWTAVVRGLSVCSRRMRRHLAEAASEEGLNDTEFLLLAACRGASERGWAQSQLAEGVGLSAAQVSGLVENLRQRGWLQAQPSARDRRRQHWVLTQAGGQLLERVWRRMQNAAVRWQRTLGSDAELFVDWLNRLAQITTTTDLGARSQQRGTSSREAA